MEKREGKSKAEITLMILVAILIIHLAFHFLYFGTGIPAFGETGISGKAITGEITNPVEGLSNLQKSKDISRYIVLGEWLLVIFLMLYVLIKGRMNLTKDTKEQETIKRVATIKYKKKGLETDIDVLLKLLKEEKVLRLSGISETFGVSNATAFEWAKILEESNFATVKYPLVGSAKLVIKETSPPVIQENNSQVNTNENMVAPKKLVKKKAKTKIKRKTVKKTRKKKRK